MTECTCTDVKQILDCGLSSAPGECLSTSHDPAQLEARPQHTEPPALNSDALTNTLTGILGGATLTNEL